MDRYAATPITGVATTTSKYVFVISAIIRDLMSIDRMSCSYAADTGRVKVTRTRRQHKADAARTQADDDLKAFQQRYVICE